MPKFDLAAYKKLPYEEQLKIFAEVRRRDLERRMKRENTMSEDADDSVLPPAPKRKKSGIASVVIHKNLQCDSVAKNNEDLTTAESSNRKDADERIDV